MRVIMFLLLMATVFACEFDTECGITEQCDTGTCVNLSCDSDEAILPHECGKLACGFGEVANEHQCMVNPILYWVGGLLGAVVVFVFFRMLYSDQVVIYQGSQKSVYRRWR